MFNNLSTMLNSLDNIAQSNLQQEPEVSATVLRQQRREAESSDSKLDSFNLSAVVSSLKKSEVSGNSSEASFVVVDENDKHSDNTISPKSTSSTSLPEYVISSKSDKQYQDSNRPSSRENTANTESLGLSKQSQTSTDKDCKLILLAKDKEIEKLNRECLDLEAQNEGLKQEVREAWEAYKLSQEKAAIREADYQEDMSQLERAKNSDKEGMALHVKTMEKELESLRSENSTIRSEHERVVKLLHGIQEESKEWMSKKAHLESSLEIAQANSNQSLEGLREELRIKDSYIETLQSEHSKVMRNAHQRYDDLEQSYADLTTTLMAKEREVTRLTQQQQLTHDQDGSLQAEVSKLQLQLEESNTSLSEEKELHRSCLRKLRASEQEGDLNKNAWDEEKCLLLARISELNSENQSKLSVKVPQSCQVRSEDEYIQLEEQLRSLGQQLLRKQESLEEYLSERAALKVRLQDSERRCKRYEDQVNALLDSQDPYDYEASAGISHGDNGVLRKRGTSSNSGGPGSNSGVHRPVRASQDLEKFGVRAGPRVTKAVDMIDTWTLVTGRHLKAYPLLRLVLVFYLLFVHLWAFCLLAYHAHSLDMENENANAMTSNKFGRI